jgi:HK97 gp10 family phage protein
MGVPSPVRIRRGNIEYVSRVDRTKYLLSELTRAALRDVAKYVRAKMMIEAKKQVGMKRSRRIGKAYQYWVRRRETDLQVGIKHGTWYGVDQELGTKNQPKRMILTKSVKENINEIRRIEGMYLSAIERENYALGLIDEGEQLGDDNE